MPDRERPARILLVDDHPVVRSGMRQLLSTTPDLIVCGEADTLDRALRAVAASQPDVVIVDLDLGGADGLDLVRQLRALHATLRLLVFSFHDEALFAHLAIKAGADGYVMKHEDGERVVHAIREVLAGRLYITRR